MVGGGLSIVSGGGGWQVAIFCFWGLKFSVSNEESLSAADMVVLFCC